MKSKVVTAHILNFTEKRDFGPNDHRMANSCLPNLKQSSLAIKIWPKIQIQDETSNFVDSEYIAIAVSRIRW